MSGLSLDQPGDLAGSANKWPRLDPVVGSSIMSGAGERLVNLFKETHLNTVQLFSQSRVGLEVLKNDAAVYDFVALGMALVSVAEKKLSNRVIFTEFAPTIIRVFQQHTKVKIPKTQGDFFNFLSFLMKELIQPHMDIWQMATNRINKIFEVFGVNNLLPKKCVNSKHTYQNCIPLFIMRDKILGKTFDNERAKKANKNNGANEVKVINGIFGPMAGRQRTTSGHFVEAGATTLTLLGHYRSTLAGVDNRSAMEALALAHQMAFSSAESALAKQGVHTKFETLSFVPTSYHSTVKKATKFAAAATLLHHVLGIVRAGGFLCLSCDGVLRNKMEAYAVRVYYWDDISKQRRKFKIATVPPRQSGDETAKVVHAELCKMQLMLDKVYEVGGVLNSREHARSITVVAVHTHSGIGVTKAFSELLARQLGYQVPQVDGWHQGCTRFDEDQHALQDDDGRGRKRKKTKLCADSLDSKFKNTFAEVPDEDQVRVMEAYMLMQKGEEQAAAAAAAAAVDPHHQGLLQQQMHPHAMQHAMSHSHQLQHHQLQMHQQAMSHQHSHHDVHQLRDIDE